MKYLERIQTILPLGYLYLILLGLLKESIQFYQLGINILSFSSITDILISPVADLAKYPVLLFSVIAILVILFSLQALLIRNSGKPWVQKILGENRFNAESTRREIQKTTLPIVAFAFGFVLLSFFVGLGIGKGANTAKRIRKGDYTYNYKINLSSGKSLDAYVFASNSAYYFYVTKDSKNVSIIPVGVIGSLEIINNTHL